MPAKLEIDREQVRLMVHSEGCRETARILGLSEDTVKSWSRRFGWIEELKAAPMPKSMVQKAAPDAPSVADLQVQAYRERRLKTRLLHSKVALENIEHLAEQPVNQRLADGGQTLTAVVKHAALADGWEEQSAQRVVVCLQALEQSSVASLATPDQGDAPDPMFD